MLLIVPAGLSAQTDSSCSATTVEGVVHHGQAFEAAIGGRLLMRLDPETDSRNPQGWTLGVFRLTGEQDLVYAATPPNRFSNPRYIDTGYGVSAAGALAWTPRIVRYFGNVRDNEQAHEALAVLLWPGNYSAADEAKARQAIETLRSYEGKLWIENGSTRPTDQSGSPERIEWMKFRANFCIPESDTLPNKR